jgi:hypothetical protein
MQFAGDGKLGPEASLRCADHLLLEAAARGEGRGRILAALGVSAEPTRVRIMTAPEHRTVRGGRSGSGGTVVMCRLDDRDVAALDMLIEAGIRTTRSDAAACSFTGIETNTALFDAIQDGRGNPPAAKRRWHSTLRAACRFTTDD